MKKVLPPVVMLPGLMCDARVFAPQIESLCSLTHVVVNHLGTGETMKLMAQHVLQNTPPYFALVGHSMGGILAMEIIAQAPERVEKLALLDTNPWSEALEVQQSRDILLQRVTRYGLESVIDEMKARYVSLDHPQRRAILKTCREMAVDLGHEVFTQQSMALRNRCDYVATLEKYQGLALVLMGENDSLCPLDRHRAMADALCNSSLKIIADCGHLSTLDKPQQVNDALRSWLNESHEKGHP